MGNTTIGSLTLRLDFNPLLLFLIGGGYVQRCGSLLHAVERVGKRRANFLAVCSHYLLWIVHTKPLTACNNCTGIMHRHSPCNTQGKMSVVFFRSVTFDTQHAHCKCPTDHTCWSLLVVFMWMFLLLLSQVVSGVVVRRMPASYVVVFCFARHGCGVMLLWPAQQLSAIASACEYTPDCYANSVLCGSNVMEPLTLFVSST